MLPTRSLRTTATALLAIACLPVICAFPQDLVERKTETIGYLQASFIDSRRLRVAIVSQPPPYKIYPAGYPWLRIIFPTPARDLRSIHQLIGLVNIDTPPKALDFVRLRTAANTGDLFHGDDLPHEEYEVISQRKLATFPSFDFPRYDVKDWPGSHDAPPSWGFLGVLSDDGFTLGRFTEPIVTRSGESGFDVTRWTFHRVSSPVINGEFRPQTMVVEKILEHVGIDGAYRRTVLISKPAPQLPDTRWRGELRL